MCVLLRLDVRVDESVECVVAGVLLMFLRAPTTCLLDGNVDFSTIFEGDGRCSVIVALHPIGDSAENLPGHRAFVDKRGAFVVDFTGVNFVAEKAALYAECLRHNLCPFWLIVVVVSIRRARWK